MRTPDPAGPTADVTVRGAPLTVTFEVSDIPVLAGGPASGSLVIGNSAGGPVAVPVGADRARRRPRYVSMAASIDGLDLSIVDPWSGLPERGGVAGRTDVEPGGTFAQQVLLNDFLTLEDTRPAMRPGQRAMLRVDCTRWLALPNPATGSPDHTTEVGARMLVEVPIVRDDDRLSALGEDLLDELLRRPPTGVQDRERAVGRLAATAAESAPHYLEALTASGDPHLAGLATEALARIDLRRRTRSPAT